MEEENLLCDSTIDLEDFSSWCSGDMLAEEDRLNFVSSQPVCNVTFLNISPETVVYKYQSRVKKQAKQRLKDAVVDILVTSSRPVKRINAWVQREPRAVELFDYDVGRVPFSQQHIILKNQRYSADQSTCENLYSIDMDAIYYDDLHKKQPVYKLAKTDMYNRNRFQLIVQLVFNDKYEYESVSQEFISSAFYCCTQPKAGLKRKAVRPLQESMYLQDLLDDNFNKHELIVADKAVIDHLNVVTCYSGPNKRDIAYHFPTEERYREMLEEGDLVGLVEEPGHEPSITLLTSANMSEIFQIGVVSRSAFFEANMAADKNTITDKICILGIVHVKVVGSVICGQRIYASSQFPGKAIVESHPMRVRKNERLIGLAMESSPFDKNLTRQHLVKCFVSFALGIANEVQARSNQEIFRKSGTKCMIWLFSYMAFLFLAFIILVNFVRLEPIYYNVL